MTAPHDATTTVLGLFDDAIDAEHALVAIQRAERSPLSISVLTATGPLGTHQDVSAGDLAKTVNGTALSAVSSWLVGLASIVIPDHGALIVAGPIGTSVARVTASVEGTAESTTDREGESARSVEASFIRFGFGAQESHYLEHRLAAGSVVIGVTDQDARAIEKALQLFADHNAVFVAQAQTDPGLIADVERGLRAPVGTAAADVVVADIVAPLVRICSTASDDDSRHVCSFAVFDRDGGKVGDVDDVLAEGRDDERHGADLLLRYYVVGRGGVFGHLRHRIAIPVELTKRHEDRITLSIDGGTLAHAPSFDPAAPFSRRDEMDVLTHFGCEPYWTRTDATLDDALQATA